MKREEFKQKFEEKTYFIADIAANHDSDLARAKMLIEKAKEAGADAAKFQHFQAKNIVSDVGFRNLKTKKSHQSAWKESVFEVYEKASLPREWTAELFNHCKAYEIDFMSSPYDFESVDLLDKFVEVYKIGSGEITWLEEIDYICKKGKPIILATGASTLEDVSIAVNLINQNNVDLVLMQCNTNYTGNNDNFKYLNLNVLKTFSDKFPRIVLGLSDHTEGCISVLGAVALGARVIEKHFTDDTGREGPDHTFSLDPITWSKMVESVRTLELALGDGIKRVEGNELETVIIQRRGLRFTQNVSKGTILTREHLSVLRPAPANSFKASELNLVVGKTTKTDVFENQDVLAKFLE